ncbi:NADH:FAD oxidoreductase [Variovorax sp. PBS-H4]|uniref:flavin reductase family protein n=1 Tax=Variovorax sp. PBS-H4 TaxID=434008 RepID=UPI001316077F|nr:flavin reductase family protein [Variovorax sp. PBS-H4]VTU22834.1 NADH:FAD oxidoreductase [Variovorax sp. PBS-H4]
MQTNSPDGLQHIFRQAMRRFTSSVSVVTASDGKSAGGLTATAISSLSMDPPTLLICVNKSAETHPLIDGTGRYCVNLLAQGQSFLAQKFAGAGGEKGLAKYVGVDFETLPSGSRALKGCLASFDCKVVATVDEASHSLFIGRVSQVLIGQAHKPLLYGDRAYVTELGEALQ